MNKKGIAVDFEDFLVFFKKYFKLLYLKDEWLLPYKTIHYPCRVYKGFIGSDSKGKNKEILLIMSFSC